MAKKRSAKGKKAIWADVKKKKTEKRKLRRKGRGRFRKKGNLTNLKCKNLSLGIFKKRAQDMPDQKRRGGGKGNKNKKRIASSKRKQQIDIGTSIARGKIGIAQNPGF